MTDKNRKSGVEDIVTDGIYHKVESFNRHSRIYGICCTKNNGEKARSLLEKDSLDTSDTSNVLSVLECDREISATSFYDFYAGILYRGTKSKDRDHDENGKRFNSRVDVRRKIFAVYMDCRDDFMSFVSRNTI